MSRAAFEEWAKTIQVKDTLTEPDHIRALFRGVAWAAWQAAESHTARECEKACLAERVSNFTEEDMAYNTALSHCSTAICTAYPDAFKEGE